MPLAQNRYDGPVIASYILTGIALLLTLYKGLLAALFSGLLVFALVHLLAPVLGRKISGERQRMIAVAILSSLIVAALSGGIWAIFDYFQSDPERTTQMLEKMADVIQASRAQLPEWLRAHL